MLNVVLRFVILYRNVRPIICEIFQEEELDDMAGQVQSLEAVKVRLEMQLEQMRKENKKESQRREEEIEDVRSAAQKKVKGE